MPVCRECSIEFYGLADDGRPCNKCTMLATTTSGVEKTVIREKAQCQSCSLVYGQLHLPLCHSCCSSFDSIPAPISLIPGAIDQILSQKSSESTSDIWGLVKGHKQNVSQHRLGVPRAQNPSLLKATASRLKGTPGIGTGITTKGQQYLQDMKDKREQGKKVKFTISMAKSVAKKSGGVTFILIPEVRFVELANEEDMVYDVLDSIVLKAQQYHTESYPLSGKIYRNIVTFYAFVTATNIFRIPATETTTGSAMDLVQYFKTQNYITQGQFDTKTLQLRLIVTQDALASFIFFICGCKSITSNTSTRTTEISQLSHHLRDLRPPKNRVLGASKLAPPLGRFWSSFQRSDCYLGSGSAKQVIYARVGSAEYAFGQSSDFFYPLVEHKKMLSEELRNLHFGELMRKEFETLARELKVPLPPFRFNLDDTILGVLEPLDDAENKLPHVHFLATPLLPCGPVDQPIQKFTGNADCGPAPTDALTMALHSFSHFVAIYTNNDAILCDLQGIHDRKKVMVLIDPQMHTAEPDSNNRMYWDNGPKAMERFLEHHLRVCSENSICNRLGMRELQYQHEEDVEDPRPQTPPGPSRGSIRQRSVSLSPVQPLRKKPYRAGTSNLLFTVEDFLRLSASSGFPLSTGTLQRKTSPSKLAGKLTRIVCELSPWPVDWGRPRAGRWMGVCRRKGRREAGGRGSRSGGAFGGGGRGSGCGAHARRGVVMDIRAPVAHDKAEAARRAAQGKGARSRQTTLRPAGTRNGAVAPPVASSSREAAHQAEASLQRAHAHIDPPRERAPARHLPACRWSASTSGKTLWEVAARLNT
ncbi:hypothetical protein B0H11DRAFT_2371922 [Mycena galericulata]|nr:hypothetical protein B0H11DRAFT_2371922 [Mycena galericulata]